MYYKYYGDNDPNFEKNINSELTKDDAPTEYYEFEVPSEYGDINPENNFRSNDVEDDFIQFIPFYSCPFFRQQHFPGGNNPPPRPPYGPPGGHQGMPPGGHGGMPSGPPPGFNPPKPQEPHIHDGIGPKAIDPGAIMRCRFRFTFIWLRNGNSFWAYITHVGRTSIAGYRWTGRRWIYFGMDLRRIESFTCH